MTTEIDREIPILEMFNQMVENSGVKAMMETLKVDELGLARVQSGEVELTNEQRDALNIMGGALSMAASWWHELPPLSEPAGIVLAHDDVAEQLAGLPGGVPEGMMVDGVLDEQKLADELAAEMPAELVLSRSRSWRDNQDARREAMWDMHRLSMMTLPQLGKRYDTYLQVIGAITKIELALVSYFGDTLPEPGMDWDPDKRMRETHRRLARLLWLEREQAKEYGGVRGVWNWLMSGRRRMSGRELFQLVMDEADAMMGLGLDLRGESEGFGEARPRLSEMVRYMEVREVLENRLGDFRRGGA